MEGGKEHHLHHTVRIEYKLKERRNSEISREYSGDAARNRGEFEDSID